jgi:hypothetical protein
MVDEIADGPSTQGHGCSQRKEAHGKEHLDHISRFELSR